VDFHDIWVISRLWTIEELTKPWMSSGRRS